MTSAKTILDTEMEHGDFDDPVSVREFLKSLLLTVLLEEESFSGKRPWGNSGWLYPLEELLEKHGMAGDEKTYTKLVDSI